jgi:putative RNA 2'-phosphotransferase
MIDQEGAGTTDFKPGYESETHIEPRLCCGEMPKACKRLSRSMSRLLRHAPHEAGLEPDEEGWVPVAGLLAGLRQKPGFALLEKSSLEKVLDSGDKRRFEISGDRIRALYGHSFPQRIARTPEQPPEKLYHGTNEEAWKSIRGKTIKPMERQHVHLAEGAGLAKATASRKGIKVVVLEVDAIRAHAAGIRFYRGGSDIWLSDEIESPYFSRLD